MVTSSLSPVSTQGHLYHKSQFLGQNHIKILPQRSISSRCPKTTSLKPISVKFNLSELLGGRGLCNGEAGVKEELIKDTKNSPRPSPANEQESVNKDITASKVEGMPENAFEKELLGLTGGFPGGEKGLKTFIEKNPPPPKKTQQMEQMLLVPNSKKPNPPELPLLLPGMIALVKNPNNPFYMYCVALCRGLLMARLEFSLKEVIGIGWLPSGLRSLREERKVLRW